MKVKIMLDFPAQVVDGGLLSALEISSFNGATPNSDAYLANSSQVQITPVTGSTKLVLLFTPGSVFDRVQVRIRAGIVPALVKLNIHYARIYHEPPVISNTPQEVCSLTPVTLSATDAPGHFIEWTEEQAGGSTVIGTGASITTSGFTGSRTYYAIATDRAGNILRICPLTINAGSAPVRDVRAYPNPAKAVGPVTVEINYPAVELQGARLVISRTTGTVVQEYNNVQPVMSIVLPSSGQLYIISLVLWNGQRATVNVLAK